MSKANDTLDDRCLGYIVKNLNRSGKREVGVCGQEIPICIGGLLRGLNEIWAPLINLYICLTSLTRAKPKEKMEFPT